MKIYRIFVLFRHAEYSEYTIIFPMIYTLVEWIQALKRHPKLYHSLNAAQFFVLLFLSAWVNSVLFL